MAQGLRHVSIVLPHNRNTRGPGEATKKVCEYVYKHSDAQGVVEVQGKRSTLLQFSSAQQRLQNVLDPMMDKYGVGLDFGQLQVSGLVSVRPHIVQEDPGEFVRMLGQKAFAASMHDRMTVEEMYDNLSSSGTQYTFDFMVMCIVSAIISSVGLISDSSVFVVASMIVSPLMNPILALTFGMATRDRRLFVKGGLVLIKGTVVCLLSGFLCGVVAGPFFGPLLSKTTWGKNSLVSAEIASRGTPWCLLTGLVIACPSGAACAIAVTSGGSAALVGIAIAAALMPPLANTGLCVAIGLWELSYDNDGAEKKFLGYAGWSFALWIINIVCIVACALAFFKFKNVSTSPARRRSLQKAKQAASRLAMSHLNRANSAEGTALLDMEDDAGPNKQMTAESKEVVVVGTTSPTSMV